MSVTKPARWAVSPAAVDPKWQWAWRGLLGYFPCWDLLDQGAIGVDAPLTWTIPGGVAGTTNGGSRWVVNNSTNFLSGVTLVNTPFGVAWDADGSSNQNGMHTEKNFQRGQQGLTMMALYRITDNSTDQRSIMNYAGSNQVVRFVQSPTNNVSFVGTTTGVQLETFDPFTGELVNNNVGTQTNTALNTWYITVYRSTPPASSPPDGTISLLNRVSNDPPFGQYVMFGVWGRVLSDAEVQQLVRDPFGPIRPSHSFSRDATWQDLNPTLRAIPGAADGP